VFHAKFVILPANVFAIFGLKKAATSDHIIKTSSCPDQQVNVEHCPSVDFCFNNQALALCKYFLPIFSEDPHQYFTTIQTDF